ncbi:MAG TPA: NAD(P)H-quinone oxidoreductase [Pyrinomonadaceae bacterium]|nr:NAD(P)H-quinone oxidoreductase [Pyrinomonadaceae bacterium]
MKAVTILNYGGVEGLEIREVQMPPPPAADRVRVKVQAAGVNRADLLQLRGKYPAPPGVAQEIPGLEFAGEIESLGPEASTWSLGQRVFGIVGGGAQAQYVVVPENTLAEIPQNLDWSEAAGVPEVFITAHDALFTQGNLSVGETLLVHAAGSGVGTAAIQLARAAGARVFGTSRTADKLKRAVDLGLSGSVVVNQDPHAFVEAVTLWTGRRGVDVLLDLVGAAYLEGNLQALSTRGRMLLVGTTSGGKASFDFSIVMRKRLMIKGTVLRARSTEEKATATRLFASQVVPLLANGILRPVIDRVHKLDEVRAAYTRLESNESFGKVVLLFD